MSQKRLEFDSSGRIKSVDGGVLSEEDLDYRRDKLIQSRDLEFLKEEKLNDIFSKDYWSLYQDDKLLDPLVFSNGKSQEDVVKEIHSLVKRGTKVIFLHGVCGTGKSAIALNLARIMGKASIVVPVKSLQKQYEEDYMNKKYLIKHGRKMKIAMITGKDNHDSVIKPGISCADPELPENISLTEKNMSKILEYYKDNPYIKNRSSDMDVDKMRRLSVAPANPYWSPILPSEYELNQMTDANKMSYEGCDGRTYIFYHRRKGCSYYDQYLSYKKADVIIFNAAKYLAELEIGRKPLTEVDIIDEADDFLDSFFQQESLNLTRLKNSIKNLYPDTSDVKEKIQKILYLIEIEEKRARAIGIDEDEVYELNDTNIYKILSILNSSPNLESELSLDDTNYGNTALEISKKFKGNLNESYLTYRKNQDDLYVRVVSTNLSGKFNELKNRSKTIILMSGTLHSRQVLEKIFGIEDFAIVEAEALQSGNMDIIMTGKELDCRYSNLKSISNSRESYLTALEECLNKAPKPILVHVNAFQDLPKDHEISKYNLFNQISDDDLRIEQINDKENKRIVHFKEGKTKTLFSTKCARGVDFPGKTCRSIIFTKYPNPNIQDTFWKILKKTHPDQFWEFYKDKARREFLQRVFRAIRFKEDHVNILSPDIRVLEEVRKLQNSK